MWQAWWFVYTALLVSSKVWIQYSLSCILIRMCSQQLRFINIQSLSYGTWKWNSFVCWGHIYARDIGVCLKCASCVSLWAIKWCVYVPLGPYVFYVLNIQLKIWWLDTGCRRHHWALTCSVTAYWLSFIVFEEDFGRKKNCCTTCGANSSNFYMMGCRWTLKGQIMQDFLSSEKQEDKRLL
jgi:hypothetical protein